MHSRLYSVIRLSASVCLLPGPVHAAPSAYEIMVSAGEIPRRESIVTLPLPDGVNEKWRLSAADAKSAAFQTTADSRVQFVIQSLDKGARKTFRLAPPASSGELTAAVETRREGSRVQVSVGGRHFISYQAEPGELPRNDIKEVFRRGGYLHPVFSPSGKPVTDDYPPNHVHHHGIWFPWTRTEFEGRQPDFWNMGEAKGRVEFTALGRMWSGPVAGGFEASHRFVDLTASEPRTALNEQWQVTVFNVGLGARQFRMLDLVSTQHCANRSPLRLPRYHYGGLGFRGNWSWNGKENTHFLTSEGETDRVKGNETRGRWCHIGGRVDGELTGIAILCHPDNFRAPQPMRVHPSEPFFCFAPSQLGDWEIAPDKPYVSRYRFIVADGPPDKAELDRLWNDYANPPKVEVRAVGN